MSNRQSKPDQLRFSGPELGDLLDRVVAEHGEEAAIAAVNRIRSGGVAGFFCREEFEVIVDPDGQAASHDDADRGTAGDDDPIRDDETIAEVIGRTAEDRPPSRLAHRRAERRRLARGPDEDTPAVTTGADPANTVTADTVSADMEADIETGQVSGLDAVAAAPVETEPGPVPETPADEVVEWPTGDDDQAVVFGGPVAPGSDPGRDRFLALLERRLDEASAAEEELGLRRSRPTVSTHAVDDRPAVPVAPAPAVAAAPVSDPTISSEPSTATPEPAVPDDRDRPVFWRRLDRVREELSSFVPADSLRTAVVGPLPLASAIVHRLLSTPALASAKVVALTDRAGIVSEPSWQLERSGDRLIRALDESDDRPTIVLIDVPADLPSWVGPLQRRLRAAGVGLFRYAVPGQPTGADLERYRQGADVPYAIDLTSRVDPARIVALVADRHPVVSVANAELGPELLLALRRHVGGAELLFEPVIRG